MKNFVLDTNVLLHDPNAIRHFPKHHVVIPLRVLEEIDQFKRELSERGRSARQVARMLDELRSKGRLCDGINLDHGGTLRVAFPNGSDVLDHNGNADKLILKLALELRNGSSDPVIVISKDINLRLKADALGLDAEDYENGYIQSAEIYSGHTEIEVPEEALNSFAEEGSLAVPDKSLLPNQYLLVRDETNPDHTLLGRFDAEAGKVVGLLPTVEQVRSIKPRNKEQRFALDALLNDKIKLVTLVGKAGTGKTLLAVAAGAYKTIDQRTYRRLLVSRPVFPMGRDIGYLPGTVEEKLDPWMQPIHDALDLLRQGRGDNDRSLDLIDIEPLTYIRGRSIPNQFLIVDESQNLTPLEVKTVITRVGHDTKIVLTGDLYQIDNPYVDITSNGLNAVVEKFRTQDIAAHVTLSQGVRSRVAELAANLL